ncbi:hypothetical protein ACPCUW_31320, partial [Nocardia sp. AB354]
GGRPPGFGKVEYTRRNVVELAFDKAEHWRAVAARYDKLALTYRAGFTLALIVEWLTSFGRHDLVVVAGIPGTFGGGVGRWVLLVVDDPGPTSFRGLDAGENPARPLRPATGTNLPPLTTGRARK